MKHEEVQFLRHGLYEIRWKKKYGGGHSLGAVGSKYNGERWLCCCDWTSDMADGTDAYGSDIWKTVKSVRLIQGDGGFDTGWRED